MDKQVLKVHAIYLNLTSQCLCQQFYHSGRKTGAFACKNRKKKIWLLAQEWDLFSSQSYWSIISKCTPQPENLRHLATCIFWLRRCIKKGLLWLMHENWIDTPRPCWWAANLNDYAISSYKAITHPLYPDQKERENFWVLILHVKTQTLEKNPWTCTRITHINSLRTHLRPEAVIWRSNVPFHLEISGCNHDVRNGRQSDRRSRTHLQADIKQRHVCVCTDRWTLMMKTCWVLSVFHLLSSSVYPLHQIVSTLTLLFKVHFQLSNPLLQSEAVTSLWRVCFAITALCKSSYKIVRN